MPAPAPNYGIDAPGVVRTFALIGTAGLAVAAAAALALGGSPGLQLALVNLGLWPGVTFLLTAAAMLHGSLRGKLRLREKLLAAIPWRGDERVLDVGCGRGLMLVGAAKRLTAGGKAVGVDLWQKEDLSGNHPDNTRANAAAEGVADRVEVADGDARRLPFPDAAFDVVLSSSAIHNIYDAAGRRKAVEEIARVTKPGGRVVIFDIRHTSEYAAAFRDLGWSAVGRSRPYFLFVIPARVVTARKPVAGADRV
jgi:arsenite methyltransferase